MDIGEVIRPWVASDSGSPEAQAELAEICGGERSTVDLASPTNLAEIELSKLVRLEIEIDPDIQGFDFPRAPSRVVTQEDFPFIVDAIRKAAIVEFGPGADSPSRE